MMIGIFAVAGTLALAFDEAGKIPQGASVALFAATAAAWAYLLL